MSYLESRKKIHEKVSADDMSGLMCSAHGCPRLWSSDFGTKLCTAHGAASDSSAWPRITDELLRQDADRARYGFHKPAPKYATREQGIEALRKLARMGSQSPRAWLDRLHARFKAGEKLTVQQRETLASFFDGEDFSAPRSMPVPTHEALPHWQDDTEQF